MNVFNASLNVIAVETEYTEGDWATVSLDVGQTLPIADPSTRRPIVFPIGTLTFRIDRDTAIQWGAKTVEQGEKMPKASSIETASNLAEAAEVARTMSQIKDG